MNCLIFLGVILDEHLSWKSHVSRQVSKFIGIMFKASFCLNKSSLLTLYYSLIYPYLLYCKNVWASTYQSNLKRLITLQKRVIRIMTRSAFDTHPEPLFKKLGILNVDNIYLLQIGKFTYLYKADFHFDSFNNMFSPTNHVHFYGTESSGLFYLPHSSTNISTSTICFQGPKFPNSLSPEIQNATSIVSFTSKLDAFLR